MKITGNTQSDDFNSYYKSNETYTGAPYNYNGKVKRILLHSLNFMGGSDNDSTMGQEAQIDDNTGHLSTFGVQVDDSSTELYGFVNLPIETTKVLSCKICCYTSDSDTQVNGVALATYVKKADGYSTKILDKASGDNPMNSVQEINHSLTQDDYNPYYFVIFCNLSTTTQTITGGWIDVAIE